MGGCMRYIECTPIDRPAIRSMASFHFLFPGHRQARSPVQSRSRSMQPATQHLDRRHPAVLEFAVEPRSADFPSPAHASSVPSTLPDFGPRSVHPPGVARPGPRNVEERRRLADAGLPASCGPNILSRIQERVEGAPARGRKERIRRSPAPHARGRRVYLERNRCSPAAVPALGPASSSPATPQIQIQIPHLRLRTHQNSSRH
jgi:hypothetical protein